jgi:RNA polymerase sigma-70 factor (family 1)
VILKQEINISNEALIKLIAAGDESAFNLLFERYRNKLYSYLVRITKSKEIAEEATLDVFLKIWNARLALEEINNFDMFLFRVAYNKGIDYIRQAATNRSRQHETWADLEKLVATEAADQKLLKSATEAAINTAVRQLSEQRREAFRLSREELLSYDEIAQRMNISRHTVRNHITAALSFIRQHLDQGPEIASIIILASSVR